MPFTDTYANQILNYTMAKTAQLEAPSAVYLGLCTNDPEVSGGSVAELSGGGYHRVMISQKNQSYPDVIGTASADSRMIQNTKQINWTKATADWPEAKGFFLSSSSTVGETAKIFFYGKLEEPVTCEMGAVALFDPYALKISFPETDVSA